MNQVTEEEALASESKITPDMFTFRVADQEAKNNEFWMPSAAVWAHDHEVGEEPK